MHSTTSKNASTNRPSDEEILGSSHIAEAKNGDSWDIWDELRAVRGGFWLIRRTAEKIHTARQLSDRETVAWYVNNAVEDHVAPLIRAALGIRKGGVL